jgi:2-amino-4-hydroxy-6-hydroxymethyldihydropteridine diphosphokinase
MPDVFVALGSNVEPERHLHRALADLERHCGSLRRSGIYRSPAFGFAGPDFLNAVVGFGSVAGPDAVKELLTMLENSAGRSRAPSGSTLCPLDLDLLLYGRRVDPVRRLPRGDLLRHAFVLAPLAQLVPELTHPVTGDCLGAAWDALAATDPLLVKLRGVRV